jgi:Holliday junction resolvasome RuvABC endonuclease subunit
MSNIILGIDQSMTSSGFVVLEDGKVSHHEVFSTVPDKEDPLQKFRRTMRVRDRTIALIEQFKPNTVSLEGLGFAATGNATRDLAGLQFLIVSAVIELFPEINVRIQTPSTVKKFATGKGGASKEAMVESLETFDAFLFDAVMKLPKTKGRSDVTDAYFMAQIEHHKSLKET